jgi:RNA recognition motif-containing protein
METSASEASAASTQPAKSPSQPGKLFVGGLSFATTEDGLLAYFSAFGTVKEAIVMRNPSSKRSRGFGFVTYEEAAAASACVNFAVQHKVDEQEVDVKHATPRAEPASPPESAGKGKPNSGARKPRHALKNKQKAAAMNGMNSVNGGAPRRGWEMASISGSSSDTGSSSAAGSSSIKSSRDSRRGDSDNGNFDDSGSIGSGDGGDGDGGGDPLAGTNKIFVGGLHYNTRKSGLMRYFEAFGEIRAAQVLFAKDTGKSRGFGFITFTEPAAVDRVLQQRMHEVDGKVTEVKRATPKVDIGSLKVQRSKSSHNHRAGGGHDINNSSTPLMGGAGRHHGGIRRGSPLGGGPRGRGGGGKGRQHVGRHRNHAHRHGGTVQYRRDEVLGGMVPMLDPTSYRASYAAMAAAGGMMPGSTMGGSVVSSMTGMTAGMPGVALAPIMGAAGVPTIMPIAVTPGSMGGVVPSPVGPVMVVMGAETAAAGDTKNDVPPATVDGAGTTAAAVPVSGGYVPVDPTMSVHHPGVVVAVDPQTGLAVQVVPVPHVIPTPAGPMLVPAPMAVGPHGAYPMAGPGATAMMGPMAGASGYSQFAWGAARGDPASQFSMMNAGEGGGIMGHFNTGDGNLMGAHMSGAASARISQGLRANKKTKGDKTSKKKKKKKKEEEAL